MKSPLELAIRRGCQPPREAGEARDVDAEHEDLSRNQPTAMLHHDPDRPHEPARTICGACQGERNRKILDAIRPRKSDAPHETARKDGWR